MSTLSPISAESFEKVAGLLGVPIVVPLLRSKIRSKGKSSGPCVAAWYVIKRGHQQNPIGPKPVAVLRLGPNESGPAVAC